MKSKRAGVTRPALKIVGAQHAAPYEIQTLRSSALAALWTLGDVELDVVTLGEAAEALRLDRREVDEHVWTDSCAIKPKLSRREPLHLTLSHTVRPQHNGARPRTGNDPRHRGVGRAQTKIRETFGPRGAQTAGDGATYAEPRAKVLTPPYPVNHDCLLVSRALLRHHRNTSDHADDAITSVFPLTAVGWRRFHVAASATVVSPTATAREHYRAAAQIAKVEVQPSGAEVPVGGKLKFTARALDAAGQPVPARRSGGSTAPCRVKSIPRASSRAVIRDTRV